MYTQPKHIFLSADRENLEYLPAALAIALRTAGYHVTENTDRFTLEYAPPPSVLEQIEQCDYFVAAITPGSLRWGHRNSYKRLIGELNHARDLEKPVILMMCYGQTANRIGRSLPKLDADRTLVIEMQDNSLTDIVETFCDLFGGEPTGQPHAAEFHENLTIERLIDEAITERYEDELYNRPGDNTRDMLDKIVESYPDFAEAHYQRGVQDQYGRKVATRFKVFSDYTSAIALNPHRAKYHASMARLKYDLRSIGEAIDDISTAIQIAPYHAFYYACRASFWGHEPQNALADYNTAVDLQPNDYLLYDRRAGVLLKLRHYHAALADIYTAEYLYGPTNLARLQIHRAVILHEMGRNKDALAVLDVVIKADPTDTNAARLRDKFSAN
ncbi:MAG: hypothetical protein AAFU54_24900 [Chloroflexota bacterium]